ncbi:MAG: hypothetical protein ISS47_02330 [Candidatus Omnitrophica bacterium]|nr:hypothetical protein [Candidatus Omnitrophota bacterium]
MKICKKCIIPDSFPDATFDDGICSFCRDYSHSSQSSKTVLGKDRLLEILTSKKHNKYHCVVPISGGKDSSYVLFYIVKELGLKPLALFFDSGFTSDVSKRNIEKICKRLSVDLVIGKSRFRQKIVKEALYILKYRDKWYELGICGNCTNSVYAFVINEATRGKIPFIIWGGTGFEMEAHTITYSSYSDPNTITFEQKFGRNIGIKRKLKKALLDILDILRSRITLVNKCKSVLHYLRYMYYCVRDNIDMGVSKGWKNLDPFLHVCFENRNVKKVPFYDYIKSDPYKYIETLKRETNWEAPFAKESRMDCKLHSIVNYLCLKNTGITQDGFFFSVLVRNGLLNRTEAMEKEEIVKRDLKSERQKVYEELGVDIGA